MAMASSAVLVGFGEAGIAVQPIVAITLRGLPGTTFRRGMLDRA